MCLTVSLIAHKESERGSHIALFSFKSFPLPGFLLQLILSQQRSREKSCHVIVTFLFQINLNYLLINERQSSLLKKWNSIYNGTDEDK